MRPSEQCACFVFRRSHVHTSARKPVILNQEFRAFPQSTQENIGILNEETDKTFQGNSNSEP